MGGGVAVEAQPRRGSGNAHIVRSFLSAMPKHGVGGRLKREGIYVYIQLIHVVVQQKLTNIVKQLYSN